MDAIQVDGGITSEASNWVFDEHVAPHFDEHVRKSVPEYDRVQELAATFSDWFTHNGSTVLDFGASTGETIRRIRDRHSKSLDLESSSFRNMTQLRIAKADGQWDEGPMTSN
jgi:hypothetical protein